MNLYHFLGFEVNTKLTSHELKYNMSNYLKTKNRVAKFNFLDFKNDVEENMNENDIDDSKRIEQFFQEILCHLYGDVNSKKIMLCFLQNKLFIYLSESFRNLNHEVDSNVIVLPTNSNCFAPCVNSNNCDLMCRIIIDMNIPVYANIPSWLLFIEQTS